jgi:DNA-binding NtrC family response regulator
MDGIELLSKFKRYVNPVIMITGHGDIDTAVETIKKELTTI